MMFVSETRASSDPTEEDCTTVAKKLTVNYNEAADIKGFSTVVADQDSTARLDETVRVTWRNGWTITNWTATTANLTCGRAEVAIDIQPLV
jgi:hypothetical protein